MKLRTSISELLLAIAMVAVGFACIAGCIHYRLMYDKEKFFRVGFWLWFGGGPMVIAGLLRPFKLARYGWVIGFFIQGYLLFYF